MFKTSLSEKGPEKLLGKLYMTDGTTSLLLYYAQWMEMHKLLFSDRMFLLFMRPRIRISKRITSTAEITSNDVI